MASTKAFYSQIIAGHILALFFAQFLKTLPDAAIASELAILEQAPDRMGQVLAQKEDIRRAVERFAKRKTYWAVVGSGPNKAAADEIRIKLSELCYKTISTDIVENKKHIDLSAEPLILVCAAGNPEAVLGDIVKDVAIFKAHKAAVTVFADADEGRFDGLADAVIRIPRSPLPLPVILNTVAGHLWGYYAAMSIDEDALFLKTYRSQINRTMVEQDKRKLPFMSGSQTGISAGSSVIFHPDSMNEETRGLFFTSVKTVSDIVLLLKYVVGKLPLEDYRHDFKNGGDLLSPIDLLDISLGQAIDELSVPSTPSGIRQDGHGGNEPQGRIASRHSLQSAEGAEHLHKDAGRQNHSELNRFSRPSPRSGAIPCMASTISMRTATPGMKRPSPSINGAASPWR